jgi:hypothetical protein
MERRNFLKSILTSPALFYINPNNIYIPVNVNLITF